MSTKTVFGEGKWEIKTATDITNNALKEIKTLLTKHIQTVPSELLSEVGHAWTTSKGNWPKRLAKVAKMRGIVLDNNLLSKAGKLARESCVVSDKTNLIITHNLDIQRGAYGDGGSCYWGCRSAARHILHELDGYALLIHDDDDYPVARCWCIPVSQEDLCLDASQNPVGINEAAYVVFNAYTRGGDSYSLIQYSRILSDLFNFPYYRDIILTCSDTQEGPLWINGGKGYIIGGVEVAAVESMDINYELICDACGAECRQAAILLDRNTILCESCYTICERCETQLSIDDAYSYGDSYYCEDCFNNNFGICERCESTAYNCDMQLVNLSNGDSVYWCEDCVASYADQCHYCDCWYTDKAMTSVHIGLRTKPTCPDCLHRIASKCDECDSWVLTDELIDLHPYHNVIVCMDCVDTNYQDELGLCRSCGSLHKVEELKPVITTTGLVINWCDTCIHKFAVVCKTCGEHYDHDSHPSAVFSGLGYVTESCPRCNPNYKTTNHA